MIGIVRFMAQVLRFDAWDAGRPQVFRALGCRQTVTRNRVASKRPAGRPNRGAGRLGLGIAEMEAEAHRRG
jgi:hypothetical protein